jgi:hypothetical protein
MSRFPQKMTEPAVSTSVLMDMLQLTPLERDYVAFYGSRHGLQSLAVLGRAVSRGLPELAAGDSQLVFSMGLVEAADPVVSLEEPQQERT